LSSIVQSSGDQVCAQFETIGGGDASVWEDGTDAFAILVADCLSSAFTIVYGPTAIVHAGCCGLLVGILLNTVQDLRTLDAQGTGTITATIGPGVCGQCYEVPKLMRDQASHEHPAICSETTWGTPALDLPAAAEDILRQRGVVVQRVDECTLTNERLFSHRRNPGAGRLTGIVWQRRGS